MEASIGCENVPFPCSTVAYYKQLVSMNRCYTVMLPQQLVENQKTQSIQHTTNTQWIPLRGPAPDKVRVRRCRIRSPPGGSRASLLHSTITAYDFVKTVITSHGRWGLSPKNLTNLISCKDLVHILTQQANSSSLLSLLHR